MDIMRDQPLFQGTPSPASFLASPSYLQWLNSGKDGRPLLQVILVRVLETQLMSAHADQYSRWHNTGRLYPWLMLPGILAWESMASLYRTTKGFMESFRTKFKESVTFKRGQTKIPQHNKPSDLPSPVGFVMDGNRRFARTLGKPVLYGHQHGAQTAGHVLEWWLRYMPNTTVCNGPGLRYLTVWAFSAENLKRSPGEVEGLFHLMKAELRSLAFNSIVHLFQIRVRVVGNLTGYPSDLLDSVKMLEESTSKYKQLFLQIAIGYGGRDEIVQSVKLLQAQGEAVTEAAISARTYCAQIDIPPGELNSEDVRAKNKRVLPLGLTGS
ncbi:Isoprenyl transferase [Psilocybe cubensis]|uniref:Isoprenyl transferase n=2 Tax=Psilocybe cubensis TaxID=181762 RepID=A0ACB8H046_PSICU|nr:Isoprenyl transferase [Psilocybe cubensis]KAH9481052.1 Isoprenyl transferase [Psilocybe cubensis]